MMPAHKPLVGIVDDDVSVRHSLVALVQCSGYSTVSFASAEEFLQAGPFPDVKFLIVDVRLPGMSGIELLDHLANTGVAKPAVVITGHADIQELGQSPHLADVSLLSKPCAPEKLLKIIANSVD
jgi:two-component system response regulator FixJ